MINIKITIARSYRISPYHPVIDNKLVKQLCYSKFMLFKFCITRANFSDFKFAKPNISKLTYPTTQFTNRTSEI